MSPYDDGWLLGSLHELAVEIAINDPRRVVLAARPPMTCFVLVCTKCHVILARDPDATSRPLAELAPDHPNPQKPITDPDCEGSGKTAYWHQVAID